LIIGREENILAVIALPGYMVKRRWHMQGCRLGRVREAQHDSHIIAAG
jgi:hypothetical protein